MDKDSFKYHLSIWCELNIDTTHTEVGKVKQFTDYVFPLPEIARIVVLSVPLWNALKSGGDSLTKLLDNHQERVGIRSVNNMACAITFHSVNQWWNAKEDLEFYPTLAHVRHANNERAAFMDSMVLLCEMFLGEAR